MRRILIFLVISIFIFSAPTWGRGNMLIGAHAPPTSPPPSGSACNNPTVPHPADVAGFTTLAYCADFTTNTGINNVLFGTAKNTTWTNLSWYDCTAHGSNGNQPGVQWFNDVGGQTLLPCSKGTSTASDTVAIDIDPATNTQALVMTAHPADGGGNGANVGLQSSAGNCPSTPNACYESFPGGNLYAETKWRFIGNGYNGPYNASILERFNFFSTPADNGCTEIDYIELFASSTTSLFPTGGGVLQCSHVGNASNTGPVVDSNYHIQGGLATANNTVSPVFWSMCAYQDGNPTQFINGSPGCTFGSQTGSEAYQQSAIIFQQEAAGNGAVAQNVSLWIAWVRIWVNGSCFDVTKNARSATNTCNTASPYQTAP